MRGSHFFAGVADGAAEQTYSVRGLRPGHMIDADGLAREDLHSEPCAAHVSMLRCAANVKHASRRKASDRSTAVPAGCRSPGGEETHNAIAHELDRGSSFERLALRL